MLDKFDEQLEMFHKDNVLHANDQIVCEYMLNPVSRKPNKGRDGYKIPKF